ncbi:MAG: hypothetical protein VXY93_14020, partial [Pseudomonadota bacterium]|nr:hypothetical protein [Pseudomonadota bacterium]
IITAVSFVGNGAGLTGIASTDNIITGTAATFNTYPVDINAGMDVVGVSSFQDIDVDGHTNLDNVSVAGVSTFASSIHVADSIIHEGDANTQINFINDQFEFKTNNISRLKIQNGNNYFYGSNHFDSTSSSPKSGTYVARFREDTGDDTVVRFHNTNVKNTVFEWNDTGNTSTAGNFVFTNLTGTEYARFTGSGNFNLLRDLDVDGHTNLDNISVAGVSTFTGDATFSGNVSIGGTLTYEDVTNVDSVGLLTARSGIRVTGGVIEAQAGENKIPSLY